MADITFEELLEAVERLTPQEKQALIEHVQVNTPSHYTPRPASSLTEEDIEVPDDIQDKQAYREVARAIAPKFYERAREYWQKTGNQERLALTDAELDKKFWLFDADGVPRLKSEKGTVEIPHDPLEDLIGLIETDQTDLSMIPSLL